MYKCKHCSYTSRRAFDLRRHENRKTPCFSEKKHKHSNSDLRNIQTSSPQNGVDIPQNEVDIPQNEVDIPQNGVDIPQNGVDIPQNGVDIPQKQPSTFECSKCKKHLSSKWSLERHKNRCKQVQSNVCPICRKVFSSRDVRNKHMKNVKCTPPPPPPGSSSNASLNCTINNTSNNNTIDNSHNINITLNFGQETLENLCSQPDYLKRMEEVVRLELQRRMLNSFECASVQDRGHPLYPNKIQD